MFLKTKLTSMNSLYLIKKKEEKKTESFWFGNHKAAVDQSHLNYNWVWSWSCTHRQSLSSASQPASQQSESRQSESRLINIRNALWPAVLLTKLPIVLIKHSRREMLEEMPKINFNLSRSTIQLGHNILGLA